MFDNVHFKMEGCVIFKQNKYRTIINKYLNHAKIKFKKLRFNF